MTSALAAWLVVWLLAASSSSSSAAVAAASQFNIVDYGAIGDGKTLNTQAIAKAIAAAAEAGGGIVVVPAGTFLTGAFNLSSHVYLELLEGGMLYASDDPKQYSCLPSVTSDTGPCDYPVVGMVGITDTGILGVGSLNGGANDPPGHLVDHIDPTLNFIYPASIALPGCVPGSCRVKLLVIKQSTDILLQGVTIENSPLWTVTAVESQRITLDGVTIRGDRRWPNNDGFDPIDSSDIVVRNVNISTGDDCMALITHTAVGISNVTVSDSTLASSSAAIKVSVYEATASGDITGLVFQNLRVVDTNRGVCFDPRHGTGRISGVLFANMSIETHYFSTPWWGAAEPIYVTSLSESQTELWTGTISNVSFANITIHSEAGVVVYGREQWIDGVTFQNVSVSIGVTTNLSRPCHDWRPAPPPDEPFALTDGFFLDGVSNAALDGCSVEFVGARPSFWGSCLNATARVTNLTRSNFVCQTGY